jgi:hypothetical protein
MDLSEILLVISARGVKCTPPNEIPGVHVLRLKRRELS